VAVSGSTGRPEMASEAAHHLSPPFHTSLFFLPNDEMKYKDDPSGLDFYYKSDCWKMAKKFNTMN